MAPSPAILFTIGYEGADLADFVMTLQAVGVPRVVDVRALAISRRKGFAKRALSSALTEAGIEYVHLRGLGNPKPGREAAWAGDDARFRSIFVSHMATDVAQVDLALAASLVVDGNSCLMCFERDHAVCHRAVVADALSVMVPVTIRPANSAWRILEHGSLLAPRSPPISHWATTGCMADQFRSIPSLVARGQTTVWPLAR